MFNNQCHTLSRDYCYLNDYTKIHQMFFNLTSNHLFHDAIPCAIKVLNYFPDILTTLHSRDIGIKESISSNQKLTYLE
jgi:hypothetical protein